MKTKNSGLFSFSADVFQGILLPEKGAILAGYSAIIAAYQLEVPLPDLISVISSKHKQYQSGTWRIFSVRHQPENDLHGHLLFALKYEGIQLWVLNALFKKIASSELEAIIESQPSASYGRRIWFLYEWLTGQRLNLKDISDKKMKFVDVLDSRQQYPGPTRKSLRHRVNNNLPGVPNFCPLIRRTEILDDYIKSNLNITAEQKIKKIHPDLLTRAAAFLLLKDSKASYAIEKEVPPQNKAERWGKAIGQAGAHALSHDEFLRLQEIVIADFRYTQPGYRNEGGFVGEHERGTNYPIPDHISARYDDLYDLMEGVIETDSLLKLSDYHPVLAATAIAFGMVFIHPYEDGNGRIHRYLIHHVLIENNFTPQGVVFPVSYVLLERIKEYKEILEYYSSPRLDYIKWRPTEKGNLEVLNETRDLYRYFDATKQAEFLFSCIHETIETVLPEEIEYLRKYDELKEFIESNWDMPARIVGLLIKFLQQEKGRLSKRARENEFQTLTEEEIKRLEEKFQSIFKERG